MEAIVQSLMVWFQKFALSVKRSSVMIWRNKGELFWQFLYPALVILLLVLVRTIRCTLPYEKMKLYPQEDLKFPKSADDETVQWKIAFSPQPKFIMDLMTRVVAFSKKYPDENEPDPEFALGLDTAILTSAVELENYLITNETDNDKMRNEILAGVEFPDEYDKLDALPEELIFALRFPAELRTCPLRRALTTNWHTNKMGDILQFNRFEDFNETNCTLGPNYIEEGFALLQHMICCATLTPALTKILKDPFIAGTGAIYNKTIPNTLMGNITTQRFPHPAPPNDPLLGLLQDHFALMLLLIMIYPCVAVAQMVVYEKEHRNKEYLRIMGLSIWMYWTTWLLAALSVIFLSLVIVVLLLKTPFFSTFHRAIFPAANPLVLFTFLFIYAISSVCFSFMIASFCERVSTLCSVLPLMWFLSYLPYFYLYHAYSHLSFIEKCLLCLFPNTAMAYGFDIFLMYELLSFGVHWDNLTYLFYDDFTLGVVMLMLLIDSIILLLLAVYIDEIYPHTIGRFRYFFCCFTCSFWGCFTGTTHGFLKRDDMRAFPPQPVLGCVGKNSSISMEHLTKEHFTKKCCIISNLDFDISEEDVTIIIGSSGTGKTLLLDLMTGMIRPTSGKIIINGYNLKWNPSRARRGIGYAPERNLLFDNLTVMEHLIFYGCLKSTYYKHRVFEENSVLLETFAMDKLVQCYPCQLSAANNKMLIVIIALCGKATLVILDEPFLGLQCTEENLIWKYIQSERLVGGRTFVLTSSNMRDITHGDRVAHLEDGQLALVNSERDADFQDCECQVKNPVVEVEKSETDGYDNYYLTIGKEKNCNMKKTTKLIQRYVPKTNIDNDVGEDFTYKLSLAYQCNFEELLCRIEEGAKDLGISYYCISTEDFRKDTVLTRSDCVDYEPTCENYPSMASVEADCNDPYHPHLIGTFHCCIQIYALIKKKLVYLRQTCLDYIFLCFITILIILLTVYVIMAGVHKAIHLNNNPPSLIVRENYKRFMSVSNSPYPGLGIVSEGYFTPLVRFRDQMRRLFYSVPDSIIQVNITEKEMNEFILEEYHYCGKGNPYQCGNTINETRCIAWHNRYIYHSLPLALNLLHICDIRNLAYRSKYNFLIVNKPLRFKKETLDLFTSETERYQKYLKQLKLPIVISITYCMSIISAYFIIFYVHERANNFKFQQILNNVRYALFWMTAFLIDFAILIIFSIVIFLIIYSSIAILYLNVIIIVMILFSFNILPMIYLCSFCFQRPRNAFIGMMAMNFYFGIHLFLLVEMISMKASNGTALGMALEYICMIFPCFNLSMTLRKIFHFEYARHYCSILCELLELPLDCDPCLEDPICCDKNSSIFGWSSGIGINLIAFVVLGLVSFGLLYLYEYSQFGCLKDLRELVEYHHYYRDVSSTHQYKTTFTNSEMKKIENMDVVEMQKYAIIIKNMTKIYKTGSRHHTILDSIYIRVKRGECIAIIGKHHCGKTTFCQLLTAEKVITKGDAFMYGYSVTNETRVTHQLIGYCPETNPYMENMTPREHLITLSLIRGINMSAVTNHIEKIAKTLKFENDLDIKLASLNEGTRRRFTISVALIGEPDILILDEPTRGLNNSAKKILFRIIKDCTTLERSIIMTGSDAGEVTGVATKIIYLETANVPIKTPKLVCGKNVCNPCTGADSLPGLTIIIKVKEREQKYDTSKKGYNCAERRECKKRTKKVAFAQADPMIRTDLIAVKEFVRRMLPCAVLKYSAGRNLCFVSPIIKQVSQECPNQFTYVIKGSGTTNIEFYEIYAAIECEKCYLNIEHYSILLRKKIPKERMYVPSAKYKSGLCDKCKE